MSVNMREMKCRMVHSYNGSPCSHLKIAGKLSLYWNEMVFKIHLVLKQDAKLCIVYGNLWKKESDTNKICSLRIKHLSWIGEKMVTPVTSKKKGTGLGESVFIICLFVCYELWNLWINNLIKKQMQLGKKNKENNAFSQSAILIHQDLKYHPI